MRTSGALRALNEDCGYNRPGNKTVAAASYTCSQAFPLPFARPIMRWMLFFCLLTLPVCLGCDKGKSDAQRRAEVGAKIAGAKAPAATDKAAAKEKADHAGPTFAANLIREDGLNAPAQLHRRFACHRRRLRQGVGRPESRDEGGENRTRAGGHQHLAWLAAFGN